MTEFIKNLLLCLTVVMVGTAQVVGAQGSYFCACSGKKTLEESCGLTCHAGAHDHEHSGSSGESGGPAPNEDPSRPADPEQGHEKVLEELIATAGPPLLHSPEVIWFAVLTDPFPAIATGLLNPSWGATFETEPPEPEVVAEGVQIARTLVLLV